MSDKLTALSFATADDSEELARAELYGLLARLWMAAPDEALLEQFKVAVTQAPQCKRSLARSRQVPSQSVRPA